VHNRHELLPIRTLVTVALLLPIAAALRAAQQGATPDAGITGRILTPDGAAVTQGNVTLLTVPSNRVNAAIDRTGHFRILPDGQGWHRLFISVPGFAPHLANVTVPSSRTMALPDITLQEPTYFHARFVSAEGEPLPAGGLRRRSIDRNGFTILDPLDHVREQVEADGSITIGPLPAGRMLMAFDRLPFAQTRLRDVDVNAAKKTIEGGTITIGPGTQLQVEIVDGAAKPVARHDVWLEDAIQPSPLWFQSVKTNEQGRAIVDRLAAGRYRVWTRTADRCNGRELTMSHLVTVGGSGVARARLVIGGRATLKITTVLGALYGRAITLAPDAPATTPWQRRFEDAMTRPGQLQMMPGSASSCGGVTDAEGRVTLTPFPPGPAQLRVHLFNSTYLARVTVPENGSEMAIAIPDGLTPLRVTNQLTHQPVTAQLTWVGGGGRVEAATTANGDALLEGVGRTGGTLTIRAREYQTLEGRFDDTPETHQEVALVPSPSARVAVRVVSSDGDAIGGAVVELLPRIAGDAAEYVAADAKGIATFTDVPEGPLQLGAHAEGFASSTIRVPEERRASIVVSLKRAQ
jgi:hypothetical protein